MKTSRCGAAACRAVATASGRFLRFRSEPPGGLWHQVAFGRSGAIGIVADIFVSSKAAGIQVLDANGAAAQMHYVLDNGDDAVGLLGNCAGRKLALNVVNGSY